MNITLNKQKIKVGDLVGFYPDNPHKFCIVSSIEGSEVWGDWYRSSEDAVKCSCGKNNGWMFISDVILISNIKRPFSECGICIGCENVKQPFECNFNCSKKLEMIKKLTRIEE